MQEYEPDPEVIADLRLRATTERDRRRTRREAYDWCPPKIVGVWKCRNPQCGVLVEVPEDSDNAARTFDRQLVAIGEQPLDRSKILYCDACHAEFRRTAPDRRRSQVDRLAVVIRQLKESEDPTRERALIEQIRTWGHPDVAGLVQTIADRRAQDTGRTGKRRSL